MAGHVPWRPGQQCHDKKLPERSCRARGLKGVCGAKHPLLGQGRRAYTGRGPHGGSQKGGSAGGTPSACSPLAAESSAACAHKPPSAPLPAPGHPRPSHLLLLLRPKGRVGVFAVLPQRAGLLFPPESGSKTRGQDLPGAAAAPSLQPRGGLSKREHPTVLQRARRGDSMAISTTGQPRHRRAPPTRAN